MADKSFTAMTMTASAVGPRGGYATTVNPPSSTDVVATITIPASTIGAKEGGNTTTEKILQKRWICDVCKIKWFLSFQEACKHEENCSGKATAATTATIDDSNTSINSSSSTDDHSVPISDIDDESKMSDSDPAPRKKSYKCSIDDLPTSAADATSSPASATNKKMKLHGEKENNKRRQHHDGKTKKSSGKEGSGSGTGGLASIFLPKTTTPMKKKNAKKMTTTMMIDITIPGASRADYEEQIVAEKVVAATADERQKKTKKQQQPSRRITKRLATLAEESDDDDGYPEEKGGGGGEKIKQVKSVFKRTRRLQKYDDDDDVKYVATTKRIDDCNITNNNNHAKNSTKNKKQKTSLSTKEFAEHQAAEMFAKRKQVAVEERSRQKKREELRRQLQRPTKGEGDEEYDNDVDILSVAAASSIGSEINGSNNDSLTSLHSIVSSIIPVPKKDVHYLTVMFPSPSHVVSKNDNIDDDYDKAEMEVYGSTTMYSSSSLRQIREIPRYQHLKPNLLPSTSTEELVCSSQPPPGLFTVNDDANESSTMYNMLSSVFDQSKKNEPSTSKQQSDEDRNQLWLDRYSMTVIPDDVLGMNNMDASKKLLSFIDEWKLRRHKAVQRMGYKQKQNKNGHKKKKKKSGYDSDESFLDDGDAGLETIFLLTGPTGSGKTRLVHAISEQLDCAVIEINSSEQRSGTALKRAIQETTQSHSSLAKSKKKQQQQLLLGNKGLRSLFCSTITCADNEEEEKEMKIYDDSASYYDSDEESVKEESSQSLTIILIDEVDLLFDDDTGFWLALSQVSQKAKCPIVVTANAIPEMTNFRFQYSSLTYPPKQDCAIKMAHVAKLQGMRFIHDLTPNEISMRLTLIAEVCHCDMRKILNEMQLFHFADSLQQPSMTKIDIHSFGLWPTTTTEFSPPSCTVEDRPLILKIEPKIIPKGKHTLMTITGKNFSPTAALSIGGKVCSNYRIISPTEIIAICPPCTIPTGVSKNLIYLDDYKKHIDCMTCKYLEVVVSKKCANGILLDPSSLLGIDSVSTNWNIEYDIPLRDDFGKENASKEDFIRKWKARSERQKKTVIENDGLLLSDEEEEFENERMTHTSNHVVYDNEEKDESTLDNECEMEDIDPQTMLDTAIAGMDILFEGSPNPSSRSASHESLQKIDRLVDELCLLSDAALLEDSLSTLAIPPLAGSVEGFGSDSFSSKDSSSLAKITNGKNKKPPSFEMLYSSGMNDSGFFFGTTDSYVTHPIMKRDRQLLSYSELYSRGLGFLDSSHSISIEENPDNSRSGVEEDETESSFFLQLRSEDDILLNPHASPTISSLQSLLKQGLDVARSHGFVVNRMPMLQSRRSQIAIKALGVGHSAIANCDLWYTGLRHDDSDEATRKVHVWRRESILDYPLSSDYLPYLRAIAHYENRITGTVNDMMKDSVNVGESSRSGRRTRTSRKQIHRHYLDECTGGKDNLILDKAQELGNQYLIIE